jgi:hypothetical protein
MTGPDSGTGERGQGSGTDLEGLLAWVRNLLWERWPLRLQYRLATPTAACDDELEGLVHGLATDLQPHARTLRSDLGIETLARLAVALLTGDVAQRFIARERTLAADPALIDGVVCLLSAHRFPSPAGS